jgi:ParB family transcriptional regulator, chromosome partitioning protein
MADTNRSPADDIAGELTRGRHALYGGPTERKEISALPLEMVFPDERQVRQTALDQAALDELAQSIKEQGLLQPIIVRPHPRDEDGQSYLIVAGHRRYEAHKLAGLERIEAIIRRDLDDRKAAELQLLENLQREDLTPLDEAAAYLRFIDEFGYSQDEVADRVGRNRTSVSKTLKINQLPQNIKDEYARLPADKRVGKSALIEIASVTDPKLQLSLWRRAKGGADVRSVREERQEKPPKEATLLKAGAQKRRIIETYKFGHDFAVEFPKRLKKLTDQMLINNQTEAGELQKLCDELEGIAEQLRAKLSAIQQQAAQEEAAPHEAPVQDQDDEQAAAQG